MNIRIPTLFKVNGLDCFLKKTKIFGAKVKLGIVDLNGKPKKLPSTLRLKLEKLSKKSIKI